MKTREILPAAEPGARALLAGSRSEGFKNRQKAISLKEEGNACFKEKKLTESLKLYTQVARFTHIYGFFVYCLCVLTQAIIKAPWPCTVQEKREKNIRARESTKKSRSETIVTGDSFKASSAVDTILALAYGNHSAVLFEMGLHQVKLVIASLYARLH